MVGCRALLPRASVAAKPYPIRTPERCPHCNSKRLIKKGTRKKKLETVPLFRCRSCRRTFSPGPRAIRNKTYPLPEILEAFTLYDRGNTLEETAKNLASIRPPPCTLDDLPLDFGAPVAHHIPPHS
jgi:transposase-like protein